MMNIGDFATERGGGLARPGTATLTLSTPASAPTAAR
jgi:hypothetical protein